MRLEGKAASVTGADFGFGFGRTTPEARAKFPATIPIARRSMPRGLGHAACFPCSDEASTIAGVAIGTDGGRCI